MPKSPSYKAHPDGIECPMLDSPTVNLNEPCWGPVEVTDWWDDPEGGQMEFYSCQGHQYMMCQKYEYVPEPPTFEGERICANCKHSERLHMKVFRKHDYSCMDISCNCKEFKHV